MRADVCEPRRGSHRGSRSCCARLREGGLQLDPGVFLKVGPLIFNSGDDLVHVVVTLNDNVVDVHVVVNVDVTKTISLSYL